MYRLNDYVRKCYVLSKQTERIFCKFYIRDFSIELIDSEILCDIKMNMKYLFYYRKG